MQITSSHVTRKLAADPAIRAMNPHRGQTISRFARILHRNEVIERNFDPIGQLRSYRRRVATGAIYRDAAGMGFLVRRDGSVFNLVKPELRAMRRERRIRVTA